MAFRLTPDERQALLTLRKTAEGERHRSDVIRRLIHQEDQRRRTRHPKPLPPPRSIPTGTTTGATPQTVCLLSQNDRAALERLINHMRDHEGLQLDAKSVLRRLIHDARRAL